MPRIDPRSFYTLATGAAEATQEDHQHRSSADPPEGKASVRSSGEPGQEAAARRGRAGSCAGGGVGSVGVVGRLVVNIVRFGNNDQENGLRVIESPLCFVASQKRDVLSRTKQARDALRHDNNKLQQKCGLLGNSDLLRDFEASGVFCFFRRRIMKASD